MRNYSFSFRSLYVDDKRQGASFRPPCLPHLSADRQRQARPFPKECRRKDLLTSAIKGREPLFALLGSEMRKYSFSFRSLYVGDKIKNSFS